MSGFLIWNSVRRSNTFLSYAKKRILRIYPELWCAVLLGFVVILVLYDAPINYGAMGLFTITQGTILQFWTPDFLRGYGCGTPNGALWTIGVTVQFYIAVYFLHKVFQNKSLGQWIILFFTSVLIALCSPLLHRILPNILYKLYNQTLIPHAWRFLLGTMVAAKREELVPFLRKYWAPLMIVSALLLWTKFDIHMGDYMLFCCITLILGVFGFAYQYPGLNIKTDISYGMYVYHMVIINAMIELGFVGRSLYLVVAFVITFLIAMISERVVGRNALLLKK